MSGQRFAGWKGAGGLEKAAGDKWENEASVNAGIADWLCEGCTIWQQLHMPVLWGRSVT